MRQLIYTRIYYTHLGRSSPFRYKNGISGWGSNSFAGNVKEIEQILETRMKKKLRKVMMEFCLNSGVSLQSVGLVEAWRTELTRIGRIYYTHLGSSTPRYKNGKSGWESDSFAGNVTEIEQILERKMKKKVMMEFCVNSGVSLQTVGLVRGDVTGRTDEDWMLENWTFDQMPVGWPARMI